MVLGIIRDLLGIGKEAIAARKEIKRATIDRDVAVINAQAAAAVKLADAGAAWEQAALSDARASWKDEFWTVILAAPLVLSFIPSTQPYIENGFAALEAMPRYYQWGLGAAWSLAFATKGGSVLAGLWARKS